MNVKLNALGSSAVDIESLDPFFRALFENCKHVTPLLDGKVSVPECEQLLPQQTEQNRRLLSALYQRLSEQHTSAGNGYWITRTWDLVCWQPMFVAFVAVYACRGVPRFDSMAQTVDGYWVAGFSFQTQAHQHGELPKLISLAGRTLSALFEVYRQDIESFTRIRPGFTQSLMSDALLNCLVKLSHFEPTLTLEEAKTHAELWLSAFQLRPRAAQQLYLDDDGALNMHRISCCQVYKCESGSYCDNCPKRARSR